MSVLSELAVPLVLAPMAGGPSTPELAAAVASAGGFGFLAGGYRTAEQLGHDISGLRLLSAAPLGVNIFVPPTRPADPQLVAAYAASLAAEAERWGVALGSPRFDDDHFAAKLDLLCQDPVAVVSFTFGLPSPAVVRRLVEVGTEVWLTVTSPAEAGAADALEPDALIVQGLEAGGHRGTHSDADDAEGEAEQLTLLVALQLITARVDRPVVAAGGLATGAAVAAVLAAGAAAAQLGTAYLCCPEAGTAAGQRAATASGTPTVLTRAFSGRLARGLANRFAHDHGPDAPHAYPEVHHLTVPLRAYGRDHGQAELVNLWAGQAHPLVTGQPAAALTRHLATEARHALALAATRLDRLTGDRVTPGPGHPGA